MAHNQARSNVKRVQKGPDLYTLPLPLALPSPSSGRPPSFRSTLSSTLRLLAGSSPSNPRCQAAWDEDSKSVWVTTPKDVEILWRRGFWGKGSLSRSEPTWLQRARNRRAIELDAQRQHLRLTAEELTAQRRLERRELKIAKAKEKAAALSTPAPSSSTPAPTSAPPALDPPTAPSEPGPVREEAPSQMPPELELELDSIRNAEHMQLMREEAFFLLWGLDCLFITAPVTSAADDDPSEPLSIPDAWSLFLTSSCPNRPLRVSNPFLISYAAFHHFRSLGWVVRSGIKFCTDYVLYGPRGPVGAHAEFAVCVIPQYDDPDDDPRKGGTVDVSLERKSWKWFSTTNRICSGVKKTLVFAYVVVPSSTRLPPSTLASPTCISHFRVHEVVVRRFLPARMRD